jgi:hypothetical protein
MSSLVELHARLGNAAVLFVLVCGLWGLIGYLRGQPVSPSFWGALVVGLRPGQLIHFLYGVLTVLSLPTAYAYSRGRSGRRESLLYGLVCLFIFGLALRAMTTGGG